MPRAGRIAGAGLGGALTGLLVGWIWDAGVTATNAAVSACESSQSGEGNICLTVVPDAAAIAGSIAVISAGTLITLGLLRVRPRKLTVPLGCIVIATAVFGTGFGFPGGEGPAPWAAAIAAGAGLVAVALSVDQGRAQLVGWVALAVVLIGSFVVPRTIARLSPTSLCLVNRPLTDSSTQDGRPCQVLMTGTKASSPSSAPTRVASPARSRAPR